FDLGAQGRYEAGEQGDFVLQEGVEPAQLLADGKEGEKGGVLHFVLHYPVPGPPENLVPVPEREAVMEVQIVCLELVCENEAGGRRERRLPQGAIEINLGLEIGCLRKGMGPAPDHVLTADFHFARRALPESSFIPVPLDREPIRFRTVPIGAKASLEHAPFKAGVLPVLQQGAVPVHSLAVNPVLDIIAVLAPDATLNEIP